VTLPRRNYLSSAIKGWEELRFNHYSWRVFDRENLVNQDIIDDFCANYLPATFDTSLLDRVGAEKANSSVSNEALVMIEETTKAYPVLSHDIYDRRRARVVSILRKADQEIGGDLRPSLKESARNEIIGRCEDLHWLQERGLTFRDIDYGSLRHSTLGKIFEEFTCVADFCPVDSERLASLKAVAETQIHQLFKAKTRHLFWPFRQL
jgi:hypothetical protein